MQLIRPVSVVPDSYERSVLLECLSAFRSHVEPLCGVPVSQDVDVDPFVTEDPERRFLSLTMSAIGNRR